jgi:hypothetical protein
MGVGVHGLKIVLDDPHFTTATAGAVSELVYAGAVIFYLTMRHRPSYYCMWAGIYISTYVCAFLMLGSVLIIDFRYWINLIIGLILALHWPQGPYLHAPDMC